MHFLAILLLVLFKFSWKSSIIGCRTGYTCVHTTIGTITLIIFVFTARKYKYRKRDDICNIYQFAEDSLELHFYR